VTIHASDPFATPDPSKSTARRLRGRLPAAVTLWTTYDGDGRPVGLTVSSLIVADGEPGRVAGLLDEEADVWAAISRSGAFAVVALGVADGRLADVFAGVLPAPGGAFAQPDVTPGEWLRTPFGPVLPGRTWAGCRLDDAQPFGWSLLVRATLIEVALTDENPTDKRPVGQAIPLVHYRGRYAGSLPPATG